MKKAGKILLPVGLICLLLSGVIGSLSIAKGHEPVGEYAISSHADGERQFQKYALHSGSLSNPDASNQPPVIHSVTADPGQLWPPDNKSKEVTITVAVTDPDGPGDITGITYTVFDEYNEREVTETPLPEDGVISLLAQRQDDDEDGRTYTVTITAYDAHNLSDSASIDIIVPYEMDAGNALILMAGIFIGPGFLTLMVILFKRESLPRLFSMTPIRINYNLKGKIVYFLCIALLAVLTAYTVFLPIKLNTITFYTGLSVYGLGLMISALVIINRAVITGGEPLMKGIYRYSRHPLYLAAFIALLGVCTVTASWICLTGSVALIVLLHFQVLSEENYLLKKYGNAYREYMKRVPRWIGVHKTVHN